MVNLIDLQSCSISEIKQSVKVFQNDNIEQFYNSPDFLALLEVLEKDNRIGVEKIRQSLLKMRNEFLNEITRVEQLYDFDKKYKYKYVAGVDEVGRGPLAGPIVAAAVILDLDKLIYYINDSKKINELKRSELSDIIKGCAIDYNIAEISNEDIDRKGIGYCNNEVFIKAVKGLKTTPNIVLTDGYAIKNWDGPYNEYVIKGDLKSASIACASIIAKVYRDDLMKKYALEYPNYGFNRNVGYGTGEHILAIKKYGETTVHRKSFLKKLNSR